MKIRLLFNQRDWNKRLEKYRLRHFGSLGLMALHCVNHGRNLSVISGGQREEILLQFDKPGKYVIRQQGMQGMQFFDMRGHPNDQILATITVSEASDDTVVPTIPIAEMEFTPGYSEEEIIKPEDIAGQETIVFSMKADFDKTPLPQSTSMASRLIQIASTFTPNLEKGGNILSSMRTITPSHFIFT